MDHNLSANFTRCHEGAWDPSTKTDGPHARHRSRMAARLADLAGTIREVEETGTYRSLAEISGSNRKKAIIFCATPLAAV